MVSAIHGQMPTSELGTSHPQNSIPNNITGTIRGRLLAIGVFITRVFGDVEDMGIVVALFCEKSRYKAGKEGDGARGEDALKVSTCQVTYR